MWMAIEIGHRQDALLMGFVLHELGSHFPVSDYLRTRAEQAMAATDRAYREWYLHAHEEKRKQ